MEGKGFDDPTRMAPGLAPAEIIRAVEAHGLRGAAELVDWFGWRNGVVAQPDGSPWVLIAPSSFQQFGLQESLAERMRLLREAEDAALNAGPVDDNDRELLDPTFWWEPTWLPVARAASPTVLAVDLAGESVSLPVRVVEWSHIDGFREIRARSLAEFVGVLLDVPDDCWAWMPEEQRWDFSGRRLPTEFSMSGFF